MLWSGEAKLEHRGTELMLGIDDAYTLLLGTKTFFDGHIGEDGQQVKVLVVKGKDEEAESPA